MYGSECQISPICTASSAELRWGLAVAAGAYAAYVGAVSGSRDQLLLCVIYACAAVALWCMPFIYAFVIKFDLTQS